MRNANGRRIRVMPAESSGTSAAVKEEDRSSSLSIQDPYVHQDYLDPQTFPESGYACLKCTVQHTAMHCDTLQRFVTHCNAL